MTVRAHQQQQTQTRKAAQTTEANAIRIILPTEHTESKMISKYTLSHSATVDSNNEAREKKKQLLDSVCGSSSRHQTAVASTEHSTLRKIVNDKCDVIVASSHPIVALAFMSMHQISTDPTAAEQKKNRNHLARKTGPPDSLIRRPQLQLFTRCGFIITILCVMCARARATKRKINGIVSFKL